MREQSIDRAAQLGAYIAAERATVREAAAHFGISKSTVFKDLTEKLPQRDPALYVSVRGVLDCTKAERHLRGGEATRQKYSAGRPNEKRI